MEKTKEVTEDEVKMEETAKATQQTEEELMRVAEEAEKELKAKEELFNEVSEATMAMDEDLVSLKLNFTSFCLKFTLSVLIS